MEEVISQMSGHLSAKVLVGAQMILVSTKPESHEYARGCLVETYPADTKVHIASNLEEVADKIAELDSIPLGYEEDGYDHMILGPDGALKIVDGLILAANTKWAGIRRQETQEAERVARAEEVEKYEAAVTLLNLHRHLYSNEGYALEILKLKAQYKIV